MRNEGNGHYLTFNLTENGPSSGTGRVHLRTYIFYARFMLSACSIVRGNCIYTHTNICNACISSIELVTQNLFKTEMQVHLEREFKHAMQVIAQNNNKQFS